MVQDFAQVVTAATPQRIDGIAHRPFEEIALKVAIGLHVTDHRLDRIAPLEPLVDPCRHPALGASDPHTLVWASCQSMR